jgi:LEA14-like dessication related protein
MLLLSNLKTILAFLLLTILFSSCKISAPTVKSLEKVNFQRSGSTGFKAGTEAVIHNPNTVRIKLKDMNIVASINGKPIATIGKVEPILIKRNSDFSIPLTIEVNSLESVFSDFKSLLNLFSKEVDLEIKGNVKLRAFWFITRSFPLQYRQKVLLPQFK